MNNVKVIENEETIKYLCVEEISPELREAIFKIEHFEMIDDGYNFIYNSKDLEKIFEIIPEHKEELLENQDDTLYRLLAMTEDEFFTITDCIEKVKNNMQDAQSIIDEARENLERMAWSY